MKARLAEHVAVVIPARNEQDHIFEIVKVAKNWAALVVVVDDGSNDRTCSEACRAGADLVRNPRPLGVGAALKIGFRYVFARGFTLAVSMDGDGAHDPAIIPAIVAYHLHSRADLTIGSRLSNRRTAAEFPSTKESANRFAALLLRAVAGTRVADVASGFRVVNESVTMLSTTSQDYGYIFESLCAASATGLKAAEYPIQARYDARDLFATRRVEIVGLLRAAKRFAKSGDHALKVRSLLQWIGSFRSMRVRISSREFIFYPLREYDSYLIQEQGSFFARAILPQGASIEF